MSDSMKPRLAADLGAIERQLAQSQPSAPAGALPPKDPLAELARIVGQDDPYRSLLAGEKAAHPRHADPRGLDDLFVSRDEYGAPAPYPPHAAGPTHGAYAPGSYAAAGYSPREPLAGSPDPYAAYAYDDPYGGTPAHPPAPEPFPAPRRSRKTLYAAGTAVAAALLGTGAAYIFNTPVRLMTSGDPPLIRATNEPSKVPPLSPGGVEIPNQNKEIYERVGEGSQTRVVNREEQPVDIRQAARMGMPGLDPDAAAAAAAQSPEFQGGPASLGLGEPRRVRTVSVRPDGTIIGADTPPPGAPPIPAPSAAVAPRSQPAIPAGITAATPDPAATPAVRALPATPVSAAPSRTPVATTPSVVPGYEPQVEVTSSATRAPARAVAVPAPQLVSPPAQLAAVAPQAAPEEAPVGGFVVQLGVRGSENDARAAFQQFQQRYAQELSGLQPLIRRAEVNGNTVYRVRVGPLARDEASSLCSRLQAAGGQCFVAKN